MTNWIFLLSTLAVVNCRPQNTQETSAVEFIIFPNGLRYPRWPSHTLPRIYPNYAFQSQTIIPPNNENFLQTNNPKSEFVKVSPKEEIRVNALSKEENANSTGAIAPYKAHPLFHYLKNRNTINSDRIISFRSDLTNPEKITTLILKPMAKAVAGIEGQAIANPLSRAILRQGMNVDILFEPDAVAIAGPGGVAHAQSDLEISYEDFPDTK